MLVLGVRSSVEGMEKVPDADVGLGASIRSVGLVAAPGWGERAPMSQTPGPNSGRGLWLSTRRCLFPVRRFNLVTWAGEMAQWAGTQPGRFVSACSCGASALPGVIQELSARRNLGSGPKQSENQRNIKPVTSRQLAPEEGGALWGWSWWASLLASPCSLLRPTPSPGRSQAPAQAPTPPLQGQLLGASEAGLERADATVVTCNQ